MRSQDDRDLSRMSKTGVRSPSTRLSCLMKRSRGSHASQDAQADRACTRSSAAAGRSENGNVPAVGCPARRNGRSETVRATDRNTRLTRRRGARRTECLDAMLVERFGQHPREGEILLRDDGGDRHVWQESASGPGTAPRTVSHAVVHYGATKGSSSCLAHGSPPVVTRSDGSRAAWRGCVRIAGGIAGLAAFHDSRIWPRSCPLSNRSTCFGQTTKPTDQRK